MVDNVIGLVYTKGVASPYDILYERADGFGPHTIGTTESALATSTPNDRKLITLGDGTIVTVYIKQLAGKYQIYINESVDDGVTWPLETHISTAPGMPLYDQCTPGYGGPSLGYDEGTDTLVCVWCGRATGFIAEDQIWASRRTGPGLWSMYPCVTDVASMKTRTQDNPAVAVDLEGVPYVVWRGRRDTYPANSQVWYGVWNGFNWGPTRISSYAGMEGFYQSLPGVVIDVNGRVHITWYGRATGYSSDQIWYAYVEGAFESTPIIASVGMEAHAQSQPSLAIDPHGVLHLTWFGYYTGFIGHLQIWYNSYVSSWDTPTRISDVAGMENQHQRHATISIGDDYSIHIVWNGNTAGPSGNIWHAYYASSWTNAFLVGGNNNNYPSFRGAVRGFPTSADLPARFFVSQYRTPHQIKDSDCWGAILCIDPNGLRADQKGPIFYLLDSCVLRPGLTDKAGGFAATINDNKTSIVVDGNQKRIYDMTLFEGDTLYIRDNDEFWLGVQEGPVTSSWINGTGGRYWFMGGWITKRYYMYDKSTRIVANIEGKCYMDLWKENYFGTDDIPRNYDEVVDILQVVVDILRDMNEAQDSNYEFRGHPDNFPGSPLTVDVAFTGTTITVESTIPFQAANIAFIWDNENYTGESVLITAIPSSTQLTIAGGILNPDGYSVGENAYIIMRSELTGVSFLKKFNNNPMFSAMQDLCERGEHEWKITPYPTGTTPAARRTLEFYPRISAPLATGAQNITYGSNIRQLPSIMVGDTTNLVTNALVTGRPVTFPEDTWRWINTGVWPDRWSRNRYYSVASTPPPPNAYSQAFADASLILDDELNPALNIQKDNNSLFQLYLSLYAQTSNIAVATLDMDLRKWRRIKGRFRHVTAVSPTIPLTVSTYGNLSGCIITVVSADADGITLVSYLREGTAAEIAAGDAEWTAETSNNVTAANIDTAINAIANVTSAAVAAVVTVKAAANCWLTYISATPYVNSTWLLLTYPENDLDIDYGGITNYRILLHTYNPTWASVGNLWRQAFYYDFGTGAKQTNTTFNDPVTSTRDIITSKAWGEIDILLPDINPDGTIGTGIAADLENDDYMHGWRPIFLSGGIHTQDTTADPTNIDFLGIYVICAERGPGGLPTDAPGTYVYDLNGTNKTFVAELELAAPAAIGDYYLEVNNSYRMVGDYLLGTGAVPIEKSVFGNPYPEYVIWKHATNWEPIEVSQVAGSDALFPGTDNVLLANPLENAYAAGDKVLCRGGWNISFSQLRFTLGSIDKAPSMPANLADPKRFRLISSDDVEYLVDIEGLADQALLDADAYQGVKVTLDGDPRRRIGLRVLPYLDPHRAAAGLPTNFHDINMVIDAAEHHIVGCGFFSVFMLGTIATRGKERVMAALSGQQETKLARTSYGTRSIGQYQRK